MLTKTMMAFTAAFTLTTASAALAEGYDYNPNDRNPGPAAYSRQTIRPFASRQAASVAAPRIDHAEKQWLDRASQSLVGGI